MESLQEILDLVFEKLQDSMNPTAYAAWIKGIEPLKMEGSTVYLQVQTQFKRDQIIGLSLIHIYKQRETIYGQRASVLNGDSLKDTILKMTESTISDAVDLFLADDENKDEWNLKGLKVHFGGWLCSDEDFVYDGRQLDDVSKADIRDTLISRAKERYGQREAEIGSDLMRELERVVLLRNVDTKWMDHIDAMDELKRGISLQAVSYTHLDVYKRQPVSRRPDSLWLVPVGNCCNVCSLGHFPQKRTNALMFVISAFRQCRGAEIIIVIKQKFFSFRQKTATIEKSIHLH